MRIPNECKLNAFKPCVRPRPKDVFARTGYRRTSQSVDGQVADFNRNPLSDFDRNNRLMNDYYYEQYRKQVEAETEKTPDKESLEAKESEMEV